MGDVCTDGRFDLIERFKRDLVEATNIETSPEEMAVLDSILFRMWQMGWLDRLEQPPASPWHRVEEPPKEDGKYVAINVKTKWWYEASYENGNWKAVDLFGQRWVVIHPTHWMPVELPREE